ncbi:MAG: metallophosphoesterase [Thermoplasmata archaeon]
MDKIEILPQIVVDRDYALYLKKSRTAVIADLHLGYEGALHEEGVSIPRFQKKIMLDRIERILKRYEPRRLIINGDFKHEFSRNLPQEWEDVNEVLDFLISRVDTVLTRGNHDNYLMTILAKRGLELIRTAISQGMTIAHGHEDVNWKGTLIIGHEHPSLQLRDEIGASIRLPCFLVSEKIIVLPAFTPLATGTNVASMGFISPPLAKLDEARTRVVAIDEKIGLLDFQTLADLKRS